MPIKKKITKCTYYREIMFYIVLNTFIYSLVLFLLQPCEAVEQHIIFAICTEAEGETFLAKVDTAASDSIKFGT